MILKLVRGLASALAGLGALGLLVLSPAIGSIGSIVGVLAALLLSPALVLKGSWRAIRTQPAIVVFLAVFAVMTVCYLVTSRKPTDVLLMASFLGLLLSPIVYVLALRWAGSRFVAIVCALLVGGALVGLLTGIYDIAVLHMQRARGWAQGGNLMARTVTLLGFLSLAGVLAESSARRWIYLLGGVSSLVALYLTGTRGVFVAVPVLGLVFVWALMRQLRASRLWYFAGAGGLAVVIGAFLVVSPRFFRIGRIFEQIVTDSRVGDYATRQRFVMLQAGWDTFIKSPWIGFGWANFTEAAKPHGIYMFHNDFFNMAVAAGTVGIGCWLALLAAPIVGVMAMPRDSLHTTRLYCALILTSSLFIFGLTDLTLGYDLPTTLYAFLTAIVLGGFRDKPATGVAQASDGRPPSMAPATA